LTSPETTSGDLMSILPDRPGLDRHLYSPPVPSPVTIVGATGDLGLGLALRLARAAVPVVLGSRDAGRAAEAAERVRAAVPEAEVRGATNPEAVTGAELVVLSVPFASQAATLKSIKDALAADAVLLDVTVPLAAAVGGRPTRTLSVWQGSAAQQAQELVPAGVRVVSGLHTVAAAHLADLGHAFDEDVLLCGDDADAKQRVAELIRLIPGLRPVDAGKLELARIAEQLTALMISINIRHKVSAGIRITGL
jgi:NADPH-dependent F420 reductase